MINKRESHKAIIGKILKNANGIGTSKTEAKANSETLGQNGQNISTKAHSIKAMENLRSTTTQYVNFVKENYGKTAQNLNNETMKEFIDLKAETLKENSLNTLITTLAKVSDNLNQLGVTKTSREAITDYRNTLKEQGHTLKTEHINRTNENTQAIINEMRNSPYSLSAELQVKAGLRANDALNFEKLKVNDNNTISVEGSKNGKDYTTIQISQDLADRTREAIQNNISISYSEYRETLKEATENTGQEFKGTHSLRYDHINQQHEINLKNGMTEQESKAVLSLNNGHEREEITEIYLAR